MDPISSKQESSVGAGNFRPSCGHHVRPEWQGVAGSWQVTQSKYSRARRIEHEQKTFRSKQPGVSIAETRADRPLLGMHRRCRRESAGPDCCAVTFVRRVLDDRRTLYTITLLG